MVAEVTSAFRQAGVPVVLLKGGALATWLYDDGTVRPYGDADLLVPPGCHAEAERVLAALGFVPHLPGRALPEWAEHAQVWKRQGAAVDLHWRLRGVRIDPALAWAVLTEDTETLALGGGRVEALGLPARALHVALHAAQHGPGHAKPGRDLARAIARLPVDVWEDASALARRLEAQEAMAVGLRLVPEGARLAARLAFPTSAPLSVSVPANTMTRGASALAELGQRPGLRAKVAGAVRLAVPTPARLRASLPPAGRSSAGLAVAYVVWPLRLAWRTVRAAVVVARIRRHASGGAGS